VTAANFQNKHLHIFLILKEFSGLFQIFLL